ncbi:MAG: dTMP kinase [Chloroflexota bacterium]
MGYFISFEGPEGSGKSTQIQLLAEALLEVGHDVLLTREPGGTVIGDAIRSILLDTTRTEMATKTELFLFNAARAQLVEETIRPALTNDKIVLCDRYADSTLAYQGYGRGCDLLELRSLCDFATGGLWPMTTIYLDIDAQVGLMRKRGGAAEEWNRMESEPLAFHQTVRNGFLALAKSEPERWLVLDASQPIEAVQQIVWQRVYIEGIVS